MAIFLDDAPHVAGTVITITVLAYLTYGMRVYTRITRKSWGIEDWLMTVAVFPFAMLSIACIVASFNGVGIHQWRLELPENAKYAEMGLFVSIRSDNPLSYNNRLPPQWFFLFEVFYCVTIVPIKLSIGFMLVRIAENRKVFIYIQYVIMAMFTLMNLIAAFYIIFQCNPVSAAWDLTRMADPNYCRPAYILEDIYYATTAVNIFTDWATAVMPIPLLWNVRLNMNAKLSVGAILSLGVFASLSACIRLKYTVNLTNSDEYLFGLANIVLWGYAENGIGVFVGNLSTLRPLFRKMLSLGGSDTNNAPTAHMATSGLPSKSYHPYQSFDAGYELGSMGAGDEKGAGNIKTSTHILGGLDKTNRDSISSDGDSHKEIMDSPTLRNRQETPTSGGIVVSRQVNISRN
ncbi:hypothetical protein BJ170DRAFT_594920 [Xylariales sp. AK1849]|nr:hypothetical protein BJ170DRAFT_594920 [Xylariales sp. AK1849]